MYKSLAFVLLFFAFLSTGYAQKEVPKDESTRYQKEVKATILEFFEGFHSGDTAKMKKTIDPNIAIQTIAKNKAGELKTVKVAVEKLLGAIQNRPADQKWDERLLLFKIDADANIANAWTPYEFYLNGNFSHCGVNVFQLYNDGNSWKIIALADTRKREGCKQE